MIKHRGNSNYVLLRGELLGAAPKLERDGRRLVELRLRLAPPGRWRDLTRDPAPILSVSGLGTSTADVARRRKAALAPGSSKPPNTEPNTCEAGYAETNASGSTSTRP